MWSTVAIPGGAAECFTGNGKLAALATMAHSANYSFSCGHPAPCIVSVQSTSVLILMYQALTPTLHPTVSHITYRERSRSKTRLFPLPVSLPTIVTPL